MDAIRKLAAELHAGRQNLWLRLLATDHLISAAIGGITHPDEDLSEEWLASAETCWQLLSGSDKVEIALQTLVSTGSPPFRGAQGERLRQNASRFFSAGVAAYWLTHHPEEARQLGRWLARIAGLENSQQLFSAEELQAVSWPRGKRSRHSALVPLIPADYRPLIAMWLRHSLRLEYDWPRTRRIPIASYGDGPNGGSIYDLELALLEGVTPKLLESPDLWNSPIAQDFIETVGNAFSEEAVSGPVVWSVSRRRLPGESVGPAMLLSGTSHTAAVRVGFRVLKNDADYDPGCLISAKVTNSGELVGVRGLDKKCDAAFAHKSFDRMVIAASGNNPAMTKAEMESYKPRLTVLPLGKLDKAAEEATGLPTGLRRYLEWARDLPDQDRPQYLGKRLFTDLYIEPDVLRGDRRRTSEPDSPGQGETRGQPRLGTRSKAEELARRYRQDMVGRERVSWRREWPRIRRAVIVGYPGEGKTMLARMTVRAMAQSGLEELGGGKVPADRITLPVCLRLEAVAESGSLEGALRRTLADPDAPILPSSVVDHLVGRILHERTWLILDGLDEVQGKSLLKRRPVKGQLARLQQAHCRVILTTRPYGYKPSDVSLGSIVEYELAPLNARQRRQFLASWFHETPEPARAERVRALVQGNASLTGVARNALLLTLVCAVSENEDRDLGPQIRRKDLYYWIIRDLIRGVWKEERRNENDLAVEREFRALRRLAGKLFAQDAARTVFTADQCFNLLRDPNTSDKDAEELLTRWQTNGLLLYTVEKRQAGLFFLHRTFLEYLAAAHTATLPDAVAVVRQYLWQPDGTGGFVWQPQAKEFITFLAGCLDEPQPVVEHLIEAYEARPDALGVMLWLAGHCLSDIGTERLAPLLVERVVSGLFGCWTRLGCPTNIAQGLAFPEGLERLISSLHRGSRLDTRIAAAQALGSLGGARGVGSLLDALNDREYNEMRAAAAAALGTLGDVRATEPLLNSLGEYGEVSCAAARALGVLGDERAVEPLRKAFCDGWYQEVRIAAAQGLSALGDDRVVELALGLIESSRSDLDRGEAVLVMAALGDARAVEPLIDSLEGDQSEWVDAEEAVEALAALGDVRAIEPLLNILKGDNRDLICAKAARALEAFGGDRAIEALLHALQTGQKKTRAHAARALGVLGDVRAVEPLIHAMQDDKDSSVCVEVARALVALGKPEAIHHLIRALQKNPDLSVREAAADALGAVGDHRAIEPLLRVFQYPWNLHRAGSLALNRFYPPYRFFPRQEK